jgi:hypothetical protein
MAMTKAGLSAVIVTKLNAQFGTPADAAPQQKFADAVADAVVSYLQASAAVAPGIAVATTGTAAAQTGATTAPGTIL